MSLSHHPVFVVLLDAVLFMAGMEIDFDGIGGYPLALVVRGWLVSVAIALLVMAGLFVLFEEFDFEGILGASAAAMIVGLATRGEDGKLFRVKVDAIFFGWLPPFFLGTGIAFDLGALTRYLETMLLIPTLLILFMAARGNLGLLYRRDIANAQQLPLALLPSVASLGLIVVITQMGLWAKNVNHDIAQVLICAARRVWPGFRSATSLRASWRAGNTGMPRTSMRRS